MPMNRKHWWRTRQRAGGSAAILAMIFLMIFGSLAAAMAIVAQANLTTADSHLKVNRARAAAETGMQYLIFRLNAVTQTVTTRDGIIDDTNASTLWTEVRTSLLTALASELHNVGEPVVTGTTLQVGPITMGPGDPEFNATFTPHPIAGEDYGAAYYQRPPYSNMDPPVSVSFPLDTTWIRVRVEAADGPDGQQIGRSVQIDFKMDKKIRFAILAKSRVMIGRNVMIEGPIGSRFTETYLENGHPIQIESDFAGLTSTLDAALDALAVLLHANDLDGDNRLRLADSAEVAAIVSPENSDINGDGYIDDYDYFLAEFDANADGIISQIELDTDGDISRAQLMELIDTFGDPNRLGYNDGQIDGNDFYAKIRGEILLTADFSGWNTGAAEGVIQNYYRGPIHPSYKKAPLTFEAPEADMHSYESTDFDTSGFKTMASGDLAAQAAAEAALNDPDDPSSPQPLGNTETESVPYGAAHPYDYYTRPVYENMTFTNVMIPMGTNALFRNCNFIGVTFVETTIYNTDPNFNYAGMVEADGTLKHPDRSADVNGTDVADTKTVSNNIRFDGCTFEGAVVSDAPPEYTHVRNKLSFTGQTQFVIDESENLSESEKALFKRSTIFAPHYSIEMGTFIDPTDTNEAVQLSGAIVAGLIDIRGNVKVNGSILTTFEPRSDVGPVIGETSPQFNTTLGYFSSSAGDLEAEIPANGVGVIQIRYDPTLALPDGILGPIEILPLFASYFEGGTL